MVTKVAPLISYMELSLVVSLLFDLDDESILLPEDVSFVSSIELGTRNHGRESPNIPRGHP